MSKKKKKSKPHYLNNKDFEELIKNYLKDPPTYESDLVEKLDLLITNILHTFKFRVDPDDARQECFVLAFKVLKNFDPEHNLKLMYTKNKKYQEKIKKYQDLRTPDYLKTGAKPDSDF